MRAFLPENRIPFGFGIVTSVVEPTVSWRKFSGSYRAGWHHLRAASQDLVLHRPLKPSGKVVGRSRIVDVIDKGPGKGVLVF